MNFQSFPLHPQILHNIERLGFRTPTPIQAKSLPVALAGQDVMGLAQTGTGKTAAFALPMIQRLIDGPRGKVRALVIAPTRELAEQIHQSIAQLTHQTGLYSLALYGGVSINRQISQLRRGVDIVVACPGRLLDHLNQQTIHLSKIEMLVLDEADQMFDMGFLPNIRKILRVLPSRRQTLLFSATMPDAINQLAQEILRQPVVVKIGHTSPAKTVKQTLFPVSTHLKAGLLVEILNQIGTESVLVFTRTKYGAINIAKRLVSEGFRATSLQGNLSQFQRQQAMNNFRNGRINILVATDIASRGLDIAGISHVINYDMPDTVEAYIHRIGRTGRADNAGEAFTLVTNKDHKNIRHIERAIGNKLEQCKLPSFDYNKANTPNNSSAQQHPSAHPARPSARPARRRPAFKQQHAAVS